MIYDLIGRLCTYVHSKNEDMENWGKQIVQNRRDFYIIFIVTIQI